MSGFKGHLLGGFLLSIVYIIFSYFVLQSLDLKDFKVYLLFIPIIIVYSLLPDADHPVSIMSKWIDWLVFYLVIILCGLMIFKGFQTIYAILVVVFVFAGMSDRIFKHRGFTHSFLALVLFSAPLYFVNVSLGVVASLSYFSHLLLDKEFKII